MALIKPCCFWQYRRVARDLLDREDELCHRLFVRLSKPEKGANQLLVKTLMRSFEADAEQDMIPAETMLEKFPDATNRQGTPVSEVAGVVAPGGRYFQRDGGA